MTGERLRVGVIGTGVEARLHLLALQLVPEIEVVAIAGARRERAVALAAEHGVPGVFTDYRTLLADSHIEAVSVTVPPYLHHRVAVAALLARKHVLCEQPMTVTVAEARDLVRLAEEAGVVNMVAHSARYRPAPLHIKRLVDSGYLGQVRTISVAAFDPTLADPRRLAPGWLLDDRGGGVLMAMGAEVVDLLVWWFGPVAGVTGRTVTTVPERGNPAHGPLRPVTVDDTAVIVLQLCSGALASIHLSATTWHAQGEHIEIYGSDGTLVLTGDGDLLGGRRIDRRLALIDLPADDQSPLPAGAPPTIAPLVRLSRAFAQAIQTGVSQPPTFADDLRVQEALSGAQKAALDGQYVVLTGRRLS